MLFLSSKYPKQPLFFLATLIVVILLSLLAYGYELTSSNIYNQLPAITTLLNPELYQNDFYVQEMTQFTPRYYYYNLILLGIKSGLGLALTGFILFFAAFSAFLTGLYALGKAVSQSRLFATVFTFLGFAATLNGRLGHADLFRIDPIPATLAMGLAIWGFYFCFRQRWILGYLFFGLACLMQFLVGALPGMLMTIPLLISAGKKQNFGQILLSFLTLGLFACLVYIPMRLAGNTSSGEISSEDFVYLYGYIRHPHHLVFSQFGLTGPGGWLNFIAFTLGGWLSIQSAKSLNGNLKLQLKSIICVACFLLCVNFVFVEIYPLDFIAKLQFARATPFSQLAVLVGISALVKEAYQKGNIPIAFLLIIAPLLRSAGILLLILGCTLWLERREKTLSQQPSNIVIFCWGFISILYISVYYQLYEIASLFILVLALGAWRNRIKHFEELAGKQWVKLLSLYSLFFLMTMRFFPVGIIVSLYFLLWLTTNSQRFKVISSVCLFILFMALYHHYDFFLFCAIAIPLVIDKALPNLMLKRLISFGLATALMVYFGFGLSQMSSSNTPGLFASRIVTNPIPEDDVSLLAQQFRQLSPEDASILVPPLDETFRFYSQRSVVFTFKGFPFTDSGIKVWRDRLETVMGIDSIAALPRFNRYALDNIYASRQSAEIVDIAKQFDADYVLTRIDWHPDLAGSVVAQQGDWLIYQIQ